VQAYLSHLALDQHAASSTQNVALSAQLFLYKHVLTRELAKVEEVRAKRLKRLPTVFKRGLGLKQQRLGRLEQSDQVAGEVGCLRTVDQAVVERQAQVEHRSRGDAVVWQHHRALFDGVYT